MSFKFRQRRWSRRQSRSRPCQVAGATGLATCDSGSPDTWQPQEKLTAMLKEKGWEVRNIKVDGGCYEVYALDEKKERVEAYFHPVTLERVKIAERVSAAAPRVAPHDSGVGRRGARPALVTRADGRRGVAHPAQPGPLARMARVRDARDRRGAHDLGIHRFRPRALRQTSCVRPRLRSPMRVTSSAKREARFVGHNPLGGVDGDRPAHDGGAGRPDGLALHDRPILGRRLGRGAALDALGHPLRVRRAAHPGRRLHVRQTPGEPGRRRCCTGASARKIRDQARGSMFAFSRKRLVGSYLRLSESRRS